ncbi:hypothetical protein FRC07_014827 [Ceratobasidium sp. 392]|nr:hypothetical protein FRC07_014827 [Ceratobasidium sp. 392]
MANHPATISVMRAGIIRAFRNLRNDTRIEKDDAILIFYAGHGCEIKAPEVWETDSQKVQALVPYDADTLDDVGKPVDVIPDRTVGALLTDIAAAKGDNVTVIFDCCHSASGTRGMNPEARVVALKHSLISSTIDQDIIRGHRSSSIPSGFAHAGLRSHVLLAACMATEIAWEREGQGAFTSAILSILKGRGLDHLTYTELIGALPTLQQQNPQCEGEYKNRVIFNNQLAGASPAMTRVEIGDGFIKLHAGFAQGITHGARFGIYQHHLNNSTSNPCMTTLEVAAIKDFYSYLTGPEAEKLSTIQNPAYACQTGAGQEHDIKVYVSPTLHQQLTAHVDYDEWQRKFLSDHSSFIARPTTSLSDADLSLDVDSDGRVSFDTHNKICNKHGIHRLPHTSPVDVKQLLDVLTSAATWNWHVGRTNPETPFKDKVRIEMFRVKEDVTQWNEDGDTRSSRSKKTSTIVNDISRDLYPYLFYFDANKLSIEHYYLGPLPSASVAEIPLNKGGYMSIGYGSSGVIPFQYCLDEGQKFDMGIIKLFVTTSPVYFGLLEQESPFEEGGRGNERRAIVKSRMVKMELWGTQSMVLLQRDTLIELGSPPAQATVPAALAFSCVPFVVFYFFILS